MSVTLLDAGLLVPSTAATSARTRWAGRILTGLAVSFLAFDAAMKLVVAPEAVEGGLYLRDARLRALLRPAG
jgi:hypothetical protein